MNLLLLALPALPCPTIATGTPSALSFDTAQVAIVRQGQDTTFSVSVNPLGDPQEFALVMPVPTLLQESDIKTLDTEIFGRLNGYSAPRHVDDAGCPSEQDYDASDGTSDTGDSGGGGVEVEATYLVGDYLVVILSAEESSALQEWLDQNGYHVPEGAEERLAEYIEAGSLFLAAKVAPEAAVASGESLAPLQIHYQSDIFAIPIRLATLNSPGEQDMVIYALTEADDDTSAGMVGVANYPEFEVASGCRWGEAGNDFSAFYEARFKKDWDFQEAGAWTVEYAGRWNDCNPCSGVSITEQDIRDLGYQGDANGHFLTRIRMRYTPLQAETDLVLYGTGFTDPVVTAYADNTAYNDCIADLCDDIPAGSSSAPGGDDDSGGDGTGGDGEGPDDDPASDGDADRNEVGGGGCGCDASGGGAALGALGALGVRRRRRG